MKKISAPFVIIFLVLATFISGTTCDSIDEWWMHEDSEPPIISDIKVTNITSTKATISWRTNEPTTSNVNFGLDTTYGSSASAINDTTDNDIFINNHNVLLTGLKPETMYYFEINIQDLAGNKAVEGDHSFTTNPAFIGDIAVHFIDVGQGDSIIIDYLETEILIDTGGDILGVTSYLQNYVDRELDVMVATHMHADHINGLDEVLDAFDVAQIWHNGDTSTSQTFEGFMDAVAAEKTDVQVANRGEQISVDGLTFYILNPVNPNDTSNNNSVVLALSYGDIDFIFTGDTEEEAEASMIAAGIFSDIEILKVGHHGSCTASSSAFLEALTPEVAVYMAAIDNT